jgi:protein-L-isoaspartate O-methyltransferase
MWRLLIIAVLGAAGFIQAQQKPDAPYIPTRPATVTAMLKLASVTPSDTVYDLGSGDGRIVIAAAKEFGARGVGIEIDEALVEQSKANAVKAGVEKMVRFERGDLFQADIHEATVVTLFLLSDVNLRLRPKLLRELRPGTRVVSDTFQMGDWKPEATANVVGGILYLWTIPKPGALRQ